MGKGNDLSFPKLKGASNWAKWERHMRLYLDTLGLWEYYEETVPCPRKLVLNEKQEEDVDWLDKHDKRNEKICKWHTNWQKGISVAMSWCSEDIFIKLEIKKLTQMNLNLIDIPSDEYYNKKWTPKNMWVYLMNQFTAQNSSKMWAVLNVFKQFSATNCKNIEEIQDKLAKINTNLVKQKMTIEQAQMMKLINTLRSVFFTYVIILNEQAHESNKMSEMNNLLMKLKDEERWMNNEITLNSANVTHNQRI